jgi:excisionase family DNA binding protein
VEPPARALTLEQAARRLGVHYMTAYRYVRTGRLPARQRGGRWEIDPADLAAVAHQKRAAAGGPVPAVGAVGARPADTVRPGGAERPAGAGRPAVAAWERLLGRLTAGDGPGAWQIVETALVGSSPASVYLDLLAPCLRAVGEGWAAGRVTIAEEHQATTLCLGIIGRLGPQFARRGRHRPGSVLLAGAEGDSHVIPLLMVADLLRAAGFSVIQLGADVPVDTLTGMARSPDLVAVGLSAATDAGAERLGEAVRRLHDVAPGVPVLVGGPALTSEAAARHLGADGWTADAAAAVDAVARLVRAR